MQKPKYDRRRLENPMGGKTHHNHRYKWKGMHRDWRIWVYMIVMLAAMLLFVMRRNWMGWIYAQPQQPRAGAAGK
jgi:hypothetical protein